MKQFIFTSLLFTLLIGPLTAQIDEQSYFAFLHETFARQDDDLHDYLVGESQRYLRLFPSSAAADEVYYILGETLSASREYDRALCHYLKLILFFPASARYEDAAARINKLLIDDVSGKVSEKKDDIINFLSTVGPGGSPDDNYYTYLKFLYELNANPLSPVIIDDIDYYIHIYSKSSHYNDHVFFWLADLYRREREWKQSVQTCSLILQLYPDSPLKPNVLFQKATILYQEENEYNRARDTFISILTDHPESEPAGDAQFFLAEIYQKEFDNAREAIDNYRLLIETYPGNHNVVEAFRRIAGIYMDQDKFQQAVETWYQLFEIYPGDPFTPSALIEIRDIYLDKLKNYPEAIKILKLFVTQYTDHPDAPEYLFEAGEIYEDELKDKQNAIDIFHEVRSKYPESRYAQKALDHIEDLSKEQ